MRKVFLITVILFAVIHAAFAQNSSSGVIKELTGVVELKTSGSDVFVAAKNGDVISQNTIVSTSFKSTAIIATGSSLITVRPLTRLSLAEIQSSSGTEKLDVSLQTGRVRVDVKPPAGTRANVTIQSPSATASVRGTSFEFDTVNMSVTEGTVAFKGAFGPAAMVKAGETNYIGTNGTPADSTAVTAASLLPQVPAGVSAYDGTRTKSNYSPTTGELIINIEF